MTDTPSWRIYMQHIVTVDEMRELEARAAREYGLTSPILMENAGRSAAEILARQIVPKDRPERSLSELTFLVLVGPGNNGGDGLVMARYLAQGGAQISSYAWKEHSLTMRERHIPGDETTEELERAITHADYILDALLGTGRSRPLPDSMRTLLGRVQQERQKRKTLRVIAIDLPTGMNADSGEVDPGTIHADDTITLACAKQGFFFF